MWDQVPCIIDQVAYWRHPDSRQASSCCLMTTAEVKGWTMWAFASYITNIQVLSSRSNYNNNKLYLWPSFFRAFHNFFKNINIVHNLRYLPDPLWALVQTFSSIQFPTLTRATDPSSLALIRYASSGVKLRHVTVPENHIVIVILTYITQFY